MCECVYACVYVCANVSLVQPHRISRHIVGGLANGSIPDSLCGGDQVEHW